jgi:selenide,water dikinase
VLLLTKPLGTGLLVSGARQGQTSESDLAGAIDSMRKLNKTASEVLVAAGIRAATDVTGFGLLGHALEMARASRTRFVFDASALPALPGALEMAIAGIETGGAAHNRRFVSDALEIGASVSSELVTLAHDPQTSGGLLAAIPPEFVAELESALSRSDVPHWRIGHVEQSPEASVALW